MNLGCVSGNYRARQGQHVLQGDGMPYLDTFLRIAGSSPQWEGLGAAWVSLGFSVGLACKSVDACTRVDGRPVLLASLISAERLVCSACDCSLSCT